MSAKREEVYRRAFLATSDLESWCAALAAHRPLLDGTEEVNGARPADVLHALTLGIYVAWLARRCGDKTRGQEANRLSADLAARVGRVPGFGGAEATAIRAVIA